MKPSEQDNKEPCTVCVDCEIDERTQQLILDFEKLRQIDTDINSMLQNIREQLVNPKQPLNGSFLTGSTVESCSIAKWFHPDPTKHEIEADMQHIAVILEKKDQSFLEAVSDKPDNVRILMTPDFLKTKIHPKVLTKLRDLQQENHADSLTFDTDTYINPQLFRTIGQRIYGFKDRKNSIGLYAAIMLQLDVEEFQSIPHEVAPPKGTALTITLKVRHITKGLLLHASLDQVVAFKCRFWPNPAAEFLRRKSRKDYTESPKWPSQELRDEIVDDGCDIVPKPSPDGDVTTEWRWSFARAERQLMDVLSANQRRSYFVIKVIFYSHIKPLNSDKIHSYWIKTAMFWFLEDKDAHDDIWCDENLINSVIDFYKELLVMIEEWNLPHFFIPSHSLLRYSPQPDLQSRLIERISEIINDATKFVPSSSECEQVLQNLVGPYNIIDSIVSFGQGKPTSFGDKFEDLTKDTPA